MSVREDLKAYLDSELPPMRMQEIREALEADPGLARELEELRTLAQSIRSAEPDYPIQGMEETLARLNRKPTARLRVVGIPLALAGAAVLAIVSFNLSHSHAEDRSAFKQEFSLARPAENAAAAASPATSAGGDLPNDVPDLTAGPADTEKYKEPALPGVEAKKSLPKSMAVPGFRNGPQSSIRPQSQAKWPQSSVANGATKIPTFDASAPSPGPARSESTSFARNSAKAAPSATPKPLVLEVASVGDVEARVRETVGSYAETVLPRAGLTKGAVAQERQLVIEVPEDRVEETLSTIKSIAEQMPAPSMDLAAEPRERSALKASSVNGVARARGKDAARAAPPLDATKSRDFDGRSPSSPQGPGGAGGFGGGGSRGGSFGANRSIAPSPKRLLVKSPMPLRKIVVVIRQKPAKRSGTGNLEP